MINREDKCEQIHHPTSAGMFAELSRLMGRAFKKNLSYINSFNHINDLRSTQKWVSEFCGAFSKSCLLNVKPIPIGFEQPLKC